MRKGDKKTKLKRNTIIDNLDGTSTVIVNSKKHGPQHVLIDTADVPLIQGYCWAVAATDPGRIYATTRRLKPDGKYTTLYMHVLIAQPAPGLVVDHIHHDTLNNTRRNLRCVPQYINAHNLRNPKKGYCQRPSGRYRTTICIQNRIVHLGTYSTEAEAAAAYQGAKRALGLVPPSV